MKKRSVFKKIGSVVIAALLVFNFVLPYMEDSIKKVNAAEPGTITYQGNTITLSDNALYVDTGLDNSGTYSFKTLQDAIANAKPGTKAQPTVIYLAPDVYWTDDYTNPADRDKDDLIGLIIAQPYITLVGMTGNPEDVVIASDRGQNAGANGNFNTIGIGDGFHAKDLTIGNYCNVDLNYKLDSSKNHKKRQESITQAQAVTKAPNITDMDEWFFENCNIISRLNLFSRDDRPDRALYKDCYMECTDDSLGTGYISIFQDCEFKLFSNTPCGGASFYMQAYLGCKFTTELSDNKTITLCKNTKPFAFIDCQFGGDMTGMEWKQSNLSDDIRQIVSNNTLNGKPFVISPSRPELSVTPDAEQMKAFKINGEYNIYNLLNVGGDEEWDPLGQKGTMLSGVWNIQFDYEGITKDVAPVLQGNSEDSLEVFPVVLGGTDKSIKWSTPDSSLILEPQSNGKVIVKANNTGVENTTARLVATAKNGMQKVLHFTVTPEITEAPVFVTIPTIQKPSDGKIKVDYEISDKGNGSVDISAVNWYRASNADGSGKVLVAKSTYVEADAKPYSSYVLRPDDIGSYIICEVMPQDSTSIAGALKFTSVSRQIEKSDVNKAEFTSYNVDLEHLAYIKAENDTAESNYEWKNEFKDGNWYGGYYLPVEYREGGVWNDKIYLPADGEDAYTYAAGASGAEGTYGLQTTTQGARLVYVDNTEREDMKMVVNLSPHKTGAQGFGSAKQFMDIYFKYDAATMTGYGLRIARVPDIDNPDLKDYAAKSCTFTLMEYTNGAAAPISESIVSTAFLPDCTVTIEMLNKVLSVDVVTSTPQDSGYPEAMLHEVHLSHTFEKVNLYGGIGFQHTGTAGAGKSGNRATIHSVNLTYNDEIIDNNGDNTDPDISDSDVQSGDNKSAALWLIIAAISGAGLVFFRRKETLVK